VNEHPAAPPGHAPNIHGIRQRQTVLALRTYRGIQALLGLCISLFLYYLIYGMLTMPYLRALADGSVPGNQDPLAMEFGILVLMFVVIYMVYSLGRAMTNLRAGRPEMSETHARSVGTATKLVVISIVLLYFWFSSVSLGFLVILNSFAEEAGASGFIDATTADLIDQVDSQMIFDSYLAASTFSNLILFAFTLAMFFMVRSIMDARGRRTFFLGFLIIIMGSFMSTSILVSYEDVILASGPTRAALYAQGSGATGLVVSMGFIVLQVAVTSSLRRLEAGLATARSGPGVMVGPSTQVSGVSGPPMDHYHPPGTDTPSITTGEADPFSRAYMSDPSVAFKRGQEELRDGNFGSAYRYFQRAHGSVPDEPLYLKAMGTAAFKRDDRNAALDAFERYLSMKGRDPDVTALIERIRNRSGGSSSDPQVSTRSSSRTTSNTGSRSTDDDPTSSGDNSEDNDTPDGE